MLEVFGEVPPAVWVAIVALVLGVWNTLHQRRRERQDDERQLAERDRIAKAEERAEEAHAIAIRGASADFTTRAHEFETKGNTTWVHIIVVNTGGSAAYNVRAGFELESGVGAIGGNTFARIDPGQSVRFDWPVDAKHLRMPPSSEGLPEFPKYLMTIDFTDGRGAQKQTVGSAKRKGSN